MNRIRLEMPIEFVFSTIIPIRITDLNYGGHIGNDTFLSLLHEARLQYYLHFGYSEMNLGGFSTIMADVAIEYKKELNYHNVIQIKVSATNFDKLGFDLFYLI